MHSDQNNFREIFDIYYSEINKLMDNIFDSELIKTISNMFTYNFMERKIDENQKLAKIISMKLKMRYLNNNNNDFAFALSVFTNIIYDIFFIDSDNDYINISEEQEKEICNIIKNFIEIGEDDEEILNILINLINHPKFKKIINLLYYNQNKIKKYASSLDKKDPNFSNKIINKIISLSDETILEQKKFHLINQEILKGDINLGQIFIKKGEFEYSGNNQKKIFQIIQEQENSENQLNIQKEIVRRSKNSNSRFLGQK